MTEKVTYPRLKIWIEEVDNGFMVESNYGGMIDGEQGKTKRYAKTLAEVQEVVGNIVDEYVMLQEDAKLVSKVRPITLRDTGVIDRNGHGRYVGYTTWVYGSV